jgi:hypothetical protein
LKTPKVEIGDINVVEIGGGNPINKQPTQELNPVDNMRGSMQSF